LRIDAFSQGKLDLTTKELVEERDTALGFLRAKAQWAIACASNKLLSLLSRDWWIDAMYVGDLLLRSSCENVVIQQCRRMVYNIVIIAIAIEVH
jgi:hypothetical protein